MAHEVISDEKKAKNARFASIMLGLGIGGISAYFLGYTFHFMDNLHTDFIEGVKNAFTNMVNSQYKYPFSFAMFKGLLIGAGIGGFVYWMSELDYQIKGTTDLSTSAGSGGLMSEKEYKEYKNLYIKKEPPVITEEMAKNMTYEELTDNKNYSQSMPLSNRFSRPIDSMQLIGNNNIFVVGGAGAGKSRFVIKPSLLQMNASYIVTDPSGEIIASVGKVLATHGYRIKIFNLSDMRYSNCYNPLEYIRDEAGVSMAINCLIENTTKASKGGDQFFIDAERLLYSACIYYLIEFCNDITQKNFAGVLRLVLMSRVNENDPNEMSELDMLFSKLPRNSLARRFYASFKQAAGKTLKSIVISCVTRLQYFMTPQVEALTSHDTLELDRIGDEKTALFIITPQADTTYSFLASLMYSQLYETLYNKGETQSRNGGSERLKIPVRMLMDEYANVGNIPEADKKISTARKYNISVTIILQDISQLEKMHKEEWKTITGNSSTAIFLGTSEPATTQYFSERLGKKTVRVRSTSLNSGKGGASKSYQYIAREVMTAEELSRLKPKECLVYTQNYRSILDKKYVYEDHPYYPQTGDADKENRFYYVKIPAYDNAKQGNFQSIYLAQHHAQRSKLKQKLEEKYNEKKTLNEALHEKKEERERLLSSWTRTYTALIAETYGDEISFAFATGIPAEDLAELAENVATDIQKTPILLFTHPEDENGEYKDYLIGMMYCKKNEKNCLDDAMTNPVTLQFTRTVKGHENCSLVLIRTKDYENYKRLVTSYAKKDEKK